jgi:DNA-directed RNA polymerase specialized sigma24 family protein
MGKTPRITEILEAVGRGAEPPAELVEYFRKEMEGCCEKAVSQALRRVVGASDVFSESMQALLDTVTKGRERFSNRKHALRYLQGTIRNVAASKARQCSAQMRSIKRTQPITQDVGQFEAISPDDELAMKEVADELRAILDAEVDPVRRMALTLRICDGLKAEDVVALLAKVYPPKDVPSARTVQRWAQNKYSELDEHFHQKYGDT